MLAYIPQWCLFNPMINISAIQREGFYPTQDLGPSFQSQHAADGDCAVSSPGQPDSCATGSGGLGMANGAGQETWISSLCGRPKPSVTAGYLSDCLRFLWNLLWLSSGPASSIDQHIYGEKIYLNLQSKDDALFCQQVAQEAIQLSA